MDIQHLVHMANQIGEFFEPMPDPAEAREGIARHVRLYWAPAMRRQMGEHIQAAGGTGLTPLVLEALRPDATTPA